jgi:uncharacterized membrane protein
LAFVAVAVFAALAVAILTANAARRVDYTYFDDSNISYEKGVVTAVSESGVEPAPDYQGLNAGWQKITVRLKNGPEKGREIEIFNVLSLIRNVEVKTGTSVVVRAERPDGIEPNYSLHSYDRTPGVAAVAVVFAVLMIAVCRWKGLRSVLGLGVSVFFVCALLLPAIYRGESPVLMSVLTAVLSAAFSMLLLNGFSQKALTAFAATVASALAALLFFAVASAILKLSGYSIPEAEELTAVANATGLQIGQLLFAGALIASLGAVTDMAVSVSSSMYEVAAKQPGVSHRELFKSGMNVGRDMAGATCQTLILAFIGSMLATVLSLMAYGTNFDQIMSSNLAAVEIAQGMTGALAVVAAVPITAGAGAFFRKKAFKGSEKGK